jgi:cytochrome c biogenesis protein CcdA/thiol-disulfide isomerase/thioredoxin
MLLPVIVGGSTGGRNQSKLRPYVITASLGISLFLFTVLLKITSLLININPIYINYFSGIVIVLLGLISLFPQLWDNFQTKLGLSTASDKLLDKATEKEGFTGAILTGAALGPVFSSCSPTFVFLLTTVLREDIFVGVLNIIAYVIGLTLIMLLISLLGQRFTKSVRWAVDPHGLFKKIIAVIFILVGIAIITGLDKKIQSTFPSLPGVGQLESGLLKASTGEESITNNDGEILNVTARPAPEITGITEWINSNGETLKGLKGQVVLIDFWTYSCINCVRSAPYINEWYNKYKGDGFTVLGLHAPEFSFEKNVENVERAVRDNFKIEYPVGLDNNFATWDAYNNQFWPAKYLIDAEGNIRYFHAGEGDYLETEKAIQLLLEESGKTVNKDFSTTNVNQDEVGKPIEGQTPETYLGWSRQANFANKDQLKPNEITPYTLQSNLNEDFWTIEGDWEVRADFIICRSQNCKLNLNFRSKEVYFVATPGTASDKKISIRLNDEMASDSVQNSEVEITKDDIYHLVSLPEYKTDQKLSLEVKNGLQINVFTFGG